MKYKKIVYIGQFIPPDGNAVAQRVYANALLLQSCGYTPILIGCKKGITQKECTKLNNGITCYVTPYPSRASTWIYRCISIKDYISIIEEIGPQDISLVISCDLQSIAQSRLRKTLKKMLIAYAEDTMEWIRHSRSKNIRTLIKDVDTYIRMKYVHIRTRNLICISQYLTNFYSNLSCNTIQLPVLIDYRASKWNTGKYTPNKIRHFIYAGDPGNIGYKERIDRTIEAACILYNEGFHLLIEIIGIDKKYFLEKCPQFKLNPAFHIVTKFYGRQSHQFCLDLIAKADASILIRENSLEMQAGFPTKLSETLRLGTPPLITMINGYEQYISPNHDCFVVMDTSIEQIKYTMRKVCTMDDSTLINIHNNSKYNTNFDYRAYQKQMNDFIQRCIHNI